MGQLGRLRHLHLRQEIDVLNAKARASVVALLVGTPLVMAGLLHDLGKMGVAEEILVKPSSLTQEEMERVRRHSELGASIIEQIRVLGDLTPIVRHHHEHWDGTGYPNGLMREEIPLEARILAVADAFEAMTGTRTHRKRMPVSAARIELQRGAGTQFDPDVVAAFERVQKINEKAFGANDGDVLDALGNLAASYMEAGRLPEARERMSKLIALMAEVSGPESLRMGLTGRPPRWLSTGRCSWRS